MRFGFAYYNHIANLNRTTNDDVIIDGNTLYATFVDNTGLTVSGYNSTRMRFIPERPTVRSGVIPVSKGEPTSGNITLTAAMLIGGLIDEDPEGAAVNWTTDTAANIVAAVTAYMAMPAEVGYTFRTILMNDATAASGEVVTILAGTNVTLHGSTVTLTEGTNETAVLFFRLTNVTGASEAVDCYILTGI